MIRAGEVIGGRFRLEHDLGEGGFGEVWKATDLRLTPRTVAVKFLKSRRDGSWPALERFDVEAKTLSVLNHPNVVSIVDRGHEDGMHYIVMEYLQGETLLSWLDGHREWKRSSISAELRS